MKTIRTALELSLLGNVSTQSDMFAKSLNRLASTGRRSLLGVANIANQMNSSLGTVFNRTTGILGSVGLAVSGKSIADLETRMTRLRLQAGVSKAEMAKLNKELFKISQQRDINIAPDELISAIEKIVGKTGDLQFAVDNMQNLAYAISATGAAGEDVGAMGADLMEKFGIKDQQEIIKTLACWSIRVKPARLNCVTWRHRASALPPLMHPPAAKVGKRLPKWVPCCK